MNEGLIATLANINTIKVVIILLILLVAVIFILRQFNIKSLFSGKGITSNIENIMAMHQRDKNILLANRVLKLVSSVARIPIFRDDEVTREYMQYNIKRAGIKGPGGFKDLSADEFRGLTILGTAIVDLVFVLFTLFGMPAVTIIGIVAATFAGSTLPKMVLRTTVAQKDAQLKAGFPDFYMMMHYVLLTGAKTPIDRVMKSYAKVTDSKEVLRFIDISVDYIETFGEYSAMQYIAKDYREVDYVGKFCRLIKQMLEGGDVTGELKGFRDELILAKKWEIEKRGDKLIARAKASFGILMVLLIQAVISAMMIYLPDLGSAGSIFGM